MSVWCVRCLQVGVSVAGVEGDLPDLDLLAVGTFDLAGGEVRNRLP